MEPDWEPASENDAHINEALFFLRPSGVPAGLEARIHSHLREARAPRRRLRLAYAAAIVLVAVAGGEAVYHASANRPADPFASGGASQMMPVASPGGSGGLGTSAARRLATQPVQVAGRARSQRRLGPGRASIARGAHRAPGVTGRAN